MPATLPAPTAARHRLLPDMRPAMAKADLRKADLADWRAAIGRAVERTRTLTQRSLKEFADAIGRDERQVARWIAGSERPQFDAIFAVSALRASAVLALAELAEEIEVSTTIRIRRDW